MDNRDAAVIIDALCRGVDPTTGEVIEDGILREPDIIRALFLALRSLEAEPSARQRADGPARAGQPWNSEEDRRLIEEFKAGKGSAELARQHSRTRGAVISRLARLGLVEAAGGGLGKSKLEPWGSDRE